MFPSSGLFADINCPLSKGVQSGLSSASGDSRDDGQQELERINQEIETVRHEVEQEQRRLSRYQTIQAETTNTLFKSSVSKSETAGKSQCKVSYGRPSCTNLTKTYSRARKYVVDNSKPRTDLEYDPLSNFSADLRSYHSSSKDQKVKNGHGLKRARIAVPCDQKKQARYQSQLSRLPSPEPHDDSSDDDVLIIDISPSPDKKTRRVPKPADSALSNSLQDNVVELKVKTASVCSPPPRLARPEAHKVASQPVSTIKGKIVDSVCSAGNSSDPPNLYENKDCKNVPVNGKVGNLSGCLKDLGRESQKITLFQAAKTAVESPPATADQRTQNWNSQVVEKLENRFLAELAQCKLPSIAKKMNPLQPYDFPPKHSLFYKDPAPSSDSQGKKHAKTAQTTELPAQNNLSPSSTNCVPSLLPHGWKTPSKIAGLMPSKAAVNQAPPESYEQSAEPDPGRARHNSSASSLTNRAESTKRHFERGDTEEVIIINSSSDVEDELDCSEMELSDSDPMEECYRIFMEANHDRGDDVQTDVHVGAIDVEKLDFTIKPQELPGRKRVAHESKHPEQPVAKSRPQPQMLVPLCEPAVSGFGSQPSSASKIHQVQQRASMLPASVKGGQALVSSACQSRPETWSAPSAAAQTPENLQLASVQNACMNYIPFGTAVIEVGNNLHLILPQAAFPLPLSSSSSSVASVLTPITQVQTSAAAVKQTYHPPAVTPTQKYRTTAPVLIPALARKPSLTSAFASAHSSSAASTSPQAATVKPLPTKRKLKQQSEAAKDKVPHDIRQRYVNMFTEEFLKTTASVDDAFEKALAEEKTVYNRSVNTLRYQSIAVNVLKRLKNQSAVAAKDENEVSSQTSKGNIPLSMKNLKGNDDMALYESLKDYILTEERLIESNYPVQHPEKPGCAVLFADKKGNADPLKRICCRCGATYSVSHTGKHIRTEECNYHYGKGVKNRVPGGVETRYSCCEGVMGAPGCQVFKLHVHNSLSLDGFVSTVPRSVSDTSCPGVFSLDCEMCYTVHGLELSRVTLVNSSLQVVYDTFVRPDNEVIDYNTRFSGISEEDVKGYHTSLREVQATLLSFISADTILIGHGLETDLCALKLLHGTVVDTSVVFPHRLGPPHKLTLNKLTAEYLRRIIQDSVCGHDTAEDAAACMELMLWKLKEDGKLKK